MIISKNWLNEIIDLSNCSTEQICAKLNSIGLEVDSLTSIRIPNNIVVGYVKTCVKHENSDHLHVCEVDVGDRILQIVCGAKNATSDIYVAVAMVGAIMPNGLEIKEAKLRGVKSSGMLCSSTELGLPKINDGIMILDDSIGELRLGKALSEYEALNDDIIEIELTPNRGDCLSIYGVARDLSAAFDIIMRDGELNIDDDRQLGIGRLLSVHCEDKINGAFAYRAVGITQSFHQRLKLAIRIAMIGSNKNTNLERVLEYITHYTGVVFRAYDYNKLANNIDEKIAITIKKQSSGAYEISCGDKILSLAGINQSDEARVDENSKIVIIEASYIDPNLISQILGDNKSIKKDEFTHRTTRGSEPNLNYAMDILFSLLSKNSSVSPYSGTQQVQLDKEQSAISFSASEISSMIGMQISSSGIAKILKKLGFDINANVEQEQIYAKAPLYRHDILNSHDICEEIVRIIGIDNIPVKALEYSEKNRTNQAYERYKLSRDIRQKAANLGFFESVHYLFDNPLELKELGVACSSEVLLNPINSELSVLKPTLINHLLNAVSFNIKNSKKSIKLFEFGDVINKDGIQRAKFGFVFSGLLGEPTLLNGAKPATIDFIHFANLIQNILGKIELKKSIDIEFLSEFEQAKVYQNGDYIGYIGRVNAVIEQSRDLFKTYICEIDFDNLKPIKKLANPYSKFQSLSRDLSIIMPKDMPYLRIKEVIEGLDIKSLKEFLPTDIYSDESLGDNVSLSVKFTFQDDAKTLEDEEIVAIMDRILAALKDNLGVGLR
ncbi:phenylalanine--tRNA ligase subunit beta [Campylobacter porcelli]|uniref:phenylalanine--tRNA ligase subunit beta n=1 Tax=Campylobacter porcelli TaxID=1660073 RepID=UPI000A335BD5|nr:phenylalanine--tRNA ligase subunit beta [Campylobacter sp. P0078]